jgi:hypothetical protein
MPSRKKSYRKTTKRGSRKTTKRCSRKTTKRGSRKTTKRGSRKVSRKRSNRLRFISHSINTSSSSDPISKHLGKDKDDDEDTLKLLEKMRKNRRDKNKPKINFETISLDDIRGDEITSYSKCGNDNKTFLYNNKCYLNKLERDIIIPLFSSSEFDIPYKEPSKEEIKRNKGMITYDCNSLSLITDNIPFPKHRSFDPLNTVLESYFNCPSKSKLENRTIVFDPAVEEWKKNNPGLLRSNKISEEALEWIETFLEYNEDPNEKYGGLSPAIIKELGQFKINGPILLFRGIGFDEKDKKYMRNMCLNDIDEKRQYLLYKDDRPSSWTINYDIALKFSSIKKFGFVLCSVFRPEDVLIDLRLLCEYGEKFVRYELEVIVKPGSYYSRVLKI